MCRKHDRGPTSTCSNFLCGVDCVVRALPWALRRMKRDSDIELETLYDFGVDAASSYAFLCDLRRAKEASLAEQRRDDDDGQ